MILNPQLLVRFSAILLNELNESEKIPRDLLENSKIYLKNVDVKHAKYAYIFGAVFDFLDHFYFIMRCRWISVNAPVGFSEGSWS